MLKKLGMIVLVLSFVIIPFPASAQDGPDAVTNYQLNMRAGPGGNHAVVTVLDPNVGLVFEARNDDLSWLLGHTADGAFRGWVASLYLTYKEGFFAGRLPYSDEVLNVAPPAPVAPDPAAPVESSGSRLGDVYAPVEGAGLPPGGIAPNLEAIPVVPAIGGRAAQIYQTGLARGNNPHMVTKVGECNSMSWAFLEPFDSGTYDLGSYGYLQSTIAAFDFSNPSAAALDGYTVASVLDPAMANPGVCGGLNPLECEYQQSRPSVAFIMVGMHDVHFLDVGQYETSLRRVIEISIEYGVIPVLTTFPVWPDGDGRTQKRFDFNNVVIRLGSEYGVPVMNFWRASNEVIHSGVGVDHVHITERGDNWTAFNGEQYTYGMTMWNLVAAQTLAALDAAVIN